MIDLLTKIEEQGIFEVLHRIEIPATPQPGYNCYTTTGEVMIYDQVLATEKLAVDNSISLPDASYLINYTIEQYNPEDGDEFDVGQNVYTNVVNYKITAHITLKGDEQYPKRASQIRMNQVLSDLKWAFGKYNNLFKNCEYIEYISSERIYNTDNDVISYANLETIWKIVYTQSIINPNIMGCN